MLPILIDFLLCIQTGTVCGAAAADGRGVRDPACCAAHAVHPAIGFPAIGFQEGRRGCDGERDHEEAPGESVVG